MRVEESIRKEKRDEEIIESHPAFGSVSLSNISGHKVLFGSELPHDSFLRIKVCSSERIYGKDKDRYYPNIKPYIEFDLTKTQFAEFLSSGNRHAGIPCTLNRFNGTSVPEIKREEESSNLGRLIKFKLEEFKNNEEKFNEPIDEIKTILNKKTIGKKDKEKIENKLNIIHYKLMDELDWAFTLLTEVSEETLDKVKSEFESYVEKRIFETGLDLLKEKQLEGKKNEEL